MFEEIEKAKDVQEAIAPKQLLFTIGCPDHIIRRARLVKKAIASNLQRL
ncbi:hypothetical protein [Coleofasciculus sp. FACHB-542]|nr:hypothetical protein [Coleofasciculus sp. FACHB-542]MBD2084982.1 hypothetical protein [Coleofasciculus sp. FACHB-542]